MGILVNGCGVSDKCKKLMPIGEKHCEKCDQSKEFYVCELTKRIAIIFIPVLKIQTKYAIMCGTCENGYYIDESQKNKLLGI